MTIPIHDQAICKVDLELDPELVAKLEAVADKRGVPVFDVCGVMGWSEGIVGGCQRRELCPQ